MNIRYVEAKLKIVKGPKEEAIRKHPDWILQNYDFGTGEWVMIAPATVLVDDVDYGDFVSKHYGQRIDKELFDIFKKDLISGKLEFPAKK